MSKPKTSKTDTKASMFVYDESVRPYLKTLEDGEGHLFVFQMGPPLRPSRLNLLIWAESEQKLMSVLRELAVACHVARRDDL